MHDHVRIIDNALTFLGRVELKGNEVQGFLEVLKFLNDYRHGLTEAWKHTPPEEKKD